MKSFIFFLLGAVYIGGAIGTWRTIESMESCRPPTERSNYITMTTVSATWMFVAAILGVEIVVFNDPMLSCFCVKPK